MDDKKVKQNEEDMSLDDLMAASVEIETDDKAESESGQAPATEKSAESNDQELKPQSDVAEETTTDATADEIQDSTDAPKEESEVEDPAPSEQETSEEEPSKVDGETDSAKTTVTPKKEYKGKWYIVHTYSGHENKVAKTLMQRVQAMGFEERIFDALVPTRDTIRVRGGKKETIKEKIFPGYILVNMDLSDEAWVLVRTTPGVTSFVGAQNKPTPIRDDEVQAIVAFVGQKDPVYKAQFSLGEAVKITDGPFSDFLGTIESIDEAKGKVKVLVSIFGRETPVELDFLQVAKI